MLFRRRQWFLSCFAMAVSVISPGCGTVLHPERRGQRGGRIDWKIFALNGIGLLFFFIPGVIAFAVDFATGAIYLPSGEVPCEPDFQSKNETDRPKLRRVKVARSQLNQRGIEAVIAKEIGKPLSLDDEKCVSREIDQIDDFWTAQEELHRLQAV
ncbi:polyribonucleotide nucleotidyltransferase [Planctomicrobium sp. SH668]|uniref:polyribonucleotide nucleotidyltransferase n=1 Tax=Planctomicrobium sp. SH668 TaxID=3448126 RepID=UPI003F5BD708